VGDPDQIEQALRNLVINAAQAMEGEPECRLDLEIRVSEDGASVQVLVEDTGCGVAHEDLELIFQPFYTTKSEGQGTGLGLPIVKTILDRHGGGISIDSAVGEGTTFPSRFPPSQSVEEIFPPSRPEQTKVLTVGR
jgi:signal transduction histidine kinase